MEKEEDATNNEKEDVASETQDVYVKDENGLDEEEKKVVDKAKELDDEVSKKQKKNTELHGYGLKIVKDITEKYNGELITKAENSTFSTLAVLKPILSQPVK